MLVSIVCYFMLLSVALAFNVDIYNFANYTNGKPVQIGKEMYKFEFNMNETLIVDIRLKNKAPDVVATVYITYEQSTNNKSGDFENVPMTEFNNEDCLSIRLHDKIKARKSKSITIGIQLNKGNVACATQIILEGNATLPDATKKDITDRSLCLNQPRCIVVMDVKKLNVCQGETHQQQPSESTSSSTSTSSSSSTPKKTNIFIYVIPSVIVMCVIILAVYFGVKKFRRRNSDPAETMELKTYSTNEVLYADLSFMNGNSQPPKLEEESPYAEIIGVLKPN